MRILAGIAAAAAIAAAAWAGARAGLEWTIGVALPYAGCLALVAGMAYRVARWALAPVPFNIAVTCGQQRSLPWVAKDALDNPQRPWAAAVRVLMETAFFRSLFRNTSAGRSGGLLVYGSAKWLWLGSMAFHWALLLVLLRHLRLFTWPVPGWVDLLQRADGLFHPGTPPLLVTNVAVVAALAFLFVRRVADRRLAYVSLFQDYFLLALIAAVALSGMYVRHFGRADMLAVKEYALGLLSFAPAPPRGAPLSLYVHIALVSTLAAVIPAGKISHMAGIFFSPTRNAAGDSRRRRHVNPWNPEVQVHTYAEWQEEFRDRLEKSGYELESDRNG